MANPQSFRELKQKFNVFTDLRITVSKEGLDALITDLRRAASLLSNKLDDLAALSAMVMQRSVLDRGANISWPMYETAAATYPISDTLKLGWDLVLSEISEPVTKMGGGAAAFGRRDALNRIRLQELRSAVKGRKETASGEADRLELRGSLKGDRGTTEFDRVWLIVEFGTGTYADPETKRLEGPTKHKDGAWWLNPKHRQFDDRVESYTFASTAEREDYQRKVASNPLYSIKAQFFTPLIIGQKPTHFLFGRRAEDVQFRDEYERVRRVVAEVLSRVLSGENVNLSNL